MRLLDEVVGATNWKREHELINGNLFCTVSIWDDEKKEWVSKQDVGVESNTEKEKGQASDAFKRACVNWGIGRELYTCPFVWINLAADEWRQNGMGKKQPKTRFYVTHIEYEEGNVSYLRIVDESGAQRFVFGMSAREKEAIMEVTAVADVVELEKVYRKYEREYSKSAPFISACTKRKNELLAAA